VSSEDEQKREIKPGRRPMSWKAPWSASVFRKYLFNGTYIASSGFEIENDAFARNVDTTGYKIETRVWLSKVLLEMYFKTRARCTAFRSMAS